MRVWMATYVGTMPGSARLYGLDADMTQGPDRGRRDMYGGTITFGPAVFQAFGTTAAPLLDGLAIRSLVVHQIWPHGDSFTWTPNAGFGDDDLARFGDAIPDKLLQAGGADLADSHPALR